jgi:hypothetical protein
LSGPATLEFIETPLGDVVRYLKEVHQIPIEVDTHALDDAGITTEVPVTRYLKEVSLRTALRLVLRDLNLTYVIEDEVLTITSAEAAALRPATRAYSVASILPGEATTAEPLGELIGKLLPRYRSEDSGGSTLATFGPLLIVRDTEEGHYELEKLLSQIAVGMIGARVQTDPFQGGR